MSYTQLTTHCGICPTTNQVMLKPEKIWVVFDCAAQFAQTSFKKQLLLGPDLTNCITEVLSRFRQETVCLTADIQSMFHHVRVEQRDCDILRLS